MSEFGLRVETAILAESRTVNETEEALLGTDDWGSDSKGYLGRMMRGERGKRSLDPLKVKALARLLHVEYEWLSIGEGPIRRDGRGPTPAEEAMVAARGFRVREDAIQLAWAKHSEHELDWTTSQWNDAIVATLDELQGKTRPEVVQEIQRQIRLKKKKLEKAAMEPQNGEHHGKLDDSSPPPRHRVARHG